MSDPVAVVTGDSRGLGAALVASLAERGYAVAGCATTSETPDGVTLHCGLDITDVDAVEGFAEEVHERLGGIGIWINNAAVVEPIGLVRATRVDAWERAVAVNLMGVVAGARAFLPRRAEQAVLVNVASRAGIRGCPGLAPYAATKAAVISLTYSIAEEECDSGLRAYAVIPPSIDTDMQDLLLGQSGERFPGVVESRRRQADGRIVAAEVAAGVITSAVLDGEPGGVVIDLTND